MRRTLLCCFRFLFSAILLLPVMYAGAQCPTGTSIDVIQNISCYGACDGNMALNDVTYYNHRYRWSNGDTTEQILNLCPGYYSVTVTDTLGTLIGSCGYSIGQPASSYITDSIINAPCSNGLGYVFLKGYPDGPYNYTFNNGENIFSTYNNTWINIDSGITSQYPGFSPGTYTVMITAGYCVSDTHSLTFTIDSVLPPLTVTADSVSPDYCDVGNGSVQLYVANADANMLYQVSNTGNYYNGYYSMLYPGNYIATMYEQYCPWRNYQFQFNIPEQTSASRISVTDSLVYASVCVPSCNGQVIINPTSGPYWQYTYIMQGNGGYISNNNVFGFVCAGPSIITIEDSFGCSINDTIIMKNTSDSLILGLTSTGISCPNGLDTTVVTATGGLPYYTIDWGDGEIDTGIASPMQHNYTSASAYGANIKLTDNFGCVGYITDSLIPSANAILIDENDQHPLCTDSNGMLWLYVSGAVPPYTYLWSTGSTLDTLYNLTVGDYYVTVTDNAGCKGYLLSHFWAYSSEPGFYTHLVTAPVNCDSTNNSITASVIGGQSPYTYSWNTLPQQNTAIATGIPPGIYSVTVADANGCSVYGSAAVNAGCYNIISGTVYNDANGNCHLDNGEAGLAGLIVYCIIDTSAYFTTTGANGYYSIAVPNAGSYQVSLNIGDGSGGCYTVCGDTGALVFFPGVDDTSGNHNLGLYYAAGSYDLTLHPGCNAANPGFQKRYWTYFYNQTYVPFSGNVTITFNYDPILIYEYSEDPSVLWDSTNHTLTWHYNTTLTYGTRQGPLNCYFIVPPTLDPSYVLQSTFNIMPDSADCTPANNTISFNQVCGGSLDPNEKEVTPSGFVSENDSVLTYTIYFQNTGTAPTNFIVIKDTLDPSLDPGTVVNLASSANYSNFNVSGHGILTWTFNPLSLPDALSNANASKGFVMFSVKRRSSAKPGTAISNTGYIYFDYNKAVVTNTVTVNLVSGISDIALSNGLSLYPNPTGDMLYIKTENLHPQTITIYDINGQQISQTAYTPQIDVKALTAGVYLIQITAPEGAARKMFVKM